MVTLLGSVVLHVSLAGLEGSCQDPGFDRNIVQDMGKPQNFLTDTGFDRYPGSGISRITLETGYPLDNSHQTDNTP